MSKVQDPEELAQELSASLTRCVPGSCAGVCVAWVRVICESPLGCCVQWRTGRTIVFTRKHLGQVGGSAGNADRSGYVCEFLSPHPCTRALGLREQLQSLREELEEVARKGRARRAQSAELNSDLCKAHRWVSLCNLRGIPGSLWATASPSKVGGRFNPFHTSSGA